MMDTWLNSTLGSTHCLICICGPKQRSLYSDLLHVVGGPGVGILMGATFSPPVQTGPGPTQPPVQWVLGLFTSRAWR